MTDPANEPRAEEPSAPGSSVRQDAPEGGLPGGQPDEASEHSGEHGGTIPIEDEQPRPEPDDEESAAEQENAETSLDQPSDG